MSHDTTSPSTQLTANRRDIIRTATGLAAAAMAGGALASTTGTAHAQGNQKAARLIGEIGTFGPFDIRSFEWGLTQAEAGGGGGSGANVVTPSEVSIIKALDATTPRHQFALAQGQQIQRATIVYTDKQGAPLHSLTFEDVRITQSRITVAGNESTEALTFTFQSLVRLMFGSSGYEWDFQTNTGQLLS